VIDYKLILQRIAETPEAGKKLVCAQVYVHHGHWDLVRLHAAAAADLIAEKYPGEFEPIELAAILVATFLQDERNRAAAPLN
jgi:hypothetical protein